MAVQIQVTFDAAHPPTLGAFWALALGYVEDAPPPGYATWDEALDAMGVPLDQRDTAYAVVDPDGVGPRLWFQKVPEAKTAKNRVHLDVNAAAGLPREERPAAVRARVAELEEAGATRVREQEENGAYWIVMLDPEGNEFCVQ
ncbi:VOC family protein [Cellulomonas rhizosphaerae]|uniref:VOC family protein n=1 Tax=Cellulomonas rhizosphaerae TaxID=2293719 RepID=A0A413RKZ5_9CELL|nr:VOC family protein [Cellulomonas rhizosphaerae]RHA40267.1 VOC family protein [Cellulomonas rhizosphaerae]